jgi:arabinose-5-phosphate isomerase
MTVEEVMTKKPKSVRPETLVASALQTINSSSITSLMVVEDGRTIGLVHLHDLLRIGAA